MVSAIRSRKIFPLKANLKKIKNKLFKKSKLKSIKRIKTASTSIVPIPIVEPYICERKFRFMANHEQHLVLHKNDQVLVKCSECGFKFRSKKELREHEILVNKISKERKVAKMSSEGATDLTKIDFSAIFENSNTTLPKTVTQDEHVQDSTVIEKSIKSNKFGEKESKDHSKNRSMNLMRVKEIKSAKNAEKVIKTKKRNNQEKDKYWSCEFCNRAFSRRANLQRHLKIKNLSNSESMTSCKGKNGLMKKISDPLKPSKKDNSHKRMKKNFSKTNEINKLIQNEFLTQVSLVRLPASSLAKTLRKTN